MLAAIALLGPTAVGAATGELVTPQAVRFERVDAVRGFPQSSIYSLTERDDGYLWLATLDGLVRFDGLRQRTYDRSTNPELSTSRLTALFDHRASGDLWIGAEDGSVIRLRDGRFSALANAGEPLGGVTGLHVSDDGRRLFVFRQGGVVELEITGGDEPEVERAGPPRRGMSVYGCGVALLAGDELWQAGPGGLFAVPLPPSLIGRSWRGCRIEPDGTIWIRATGSDIWRIDGDRIERYERSPAVPEDALPLLEDARGDLWLRFLSPPRLGRLAADGQVLRYDEAFGVDPLGDPVAAHVDREGGLWIGTTIGVYRHLGEAISGLHLRADGVDTAVSVHHEAADGTVWIAGRDASLSALRPGGALVQFTVGDQAGRQILRPELSRGPDGQPWSRAPLGLNAVAVFREDDAGWLWIGVDIGLLVHRGDGEIVIHRADADDGISIPGGVNDLLIDEGGLWLATPLAVVRFEDGRVRRIYGPDEGIKEGVLALLRDHEGVLWAATRAGVLRLRDGRFEAIEGLGPAIGQARALHEDGEGRLWIGTYDRGLFRLRPDGAVEHAGPAEGMPAGVFTLHFDDRGFLWTTSNRGLSRTRVAAVDRILGGGEGRISATLYDRSAGLPASECNGGFGYAGYACGRDAWCVHTMGGVGVAHPGAVRVVDAPPRPVIESARIDGVRRSIDDGSLAIAPEERDLVIRYTGVTFDRATEVTFRHRMFGHDGRWIDAETRREALFSDLPPGEYTFEVIAESGEGVESPSPARLAVIVEPAWWELGWVRVAALLLALGLTGAALQWRLRALRRQHRRREEALRAAADELEARVRERTAVLAAEVLERRRAEQAARQASAAKSAFVAQMSHELRTPMNAIIGLSELLSRSPLSAEQRAWLQTVRTSGDALLSIIEDILDFSRIEAGRLELERRTFDPAAVTREALEIVGPQARNKGLAIALRADPGLPDAVVGDPTRLRQVLLNLLSNAVKFTLQGSIDVELAATASDAGWRLKIAIRDTGIGIDPEARARIFDPFAQGDGSTSRRFGGSGLGLAIVQRLLTALGGALDLESRVGVGSTFTVEVPVGRPIEAPAGDGGGAIAAAEARPGPRPLRVLITEDDPINQTVAEAIVARGGHTCALASSGEEALDLLHREDFDVVLMDLHMPGIGGLEASRRIRAEVPPDRQPWIIALTAAVTVQDREASLAAGMNDFLGKPVRDAEVRGALARAAAAG